MANKRSFFYKKITVPAGGDFPDEAQLKFGFDATRVIISNDGDDAALSFSFLKPHLDGELFCSDGPVTFEDLSEGRLWFKASDETTVRVWAWRR